MSAFGKTPERERFLVDSIAAWTAVHVAAGADLQEAELAAHRAREAYSNAG